MKVAVLGAGMMGRAAVYHLSRAAGVREVVLADRDPKRAAAVAKQHGNGKTRPVGLDVADGKAVRKFLDGCAAALGAVSYRVNEPMTRACIDAGVHYVDLGGNNDVVKAQFALSDQAKKAGVAIVPDCGLAPGLVSILAARCLELLPKVDSIKLRVGGLPLKRKPPLDYQVVFSVEGLINEYKEPTVCLRSGKLTTVPSLGEVETLEFPKPFGTLEAFTTSGGASTLPWTLKGKVKNLDYKTIRYPGHVHFLQCLFALGFADEEKIEVEGVRVNPRRFTERMFERTLTSDAPDCILAWVEGSGPKGKVAFRLIDKADAKTGLSSMMRCTAFPAAIVAHMLARGDVEARGTLHQEFSIPPGAFIEELRKTGIKLQQE